MATNSPKKAERAAYVGKLRAAAKATGVGTPNVGSSSATSASGEPPSKDKSTERNAKEGGRAVLGSSDAHKAIKDCLSGVKSFSGNEKEVGEYAAGVMKAWGRLRIAVHTLSLSSLPLASFGTLLSTAFDERFPLGKWAIACGEKMLDEEAEPALVL